VQAKEKPFSSKLLRKTVIVFILIKLVKPYTHKIWKFLLSLFRFTILIKL